MEIIKKLLFEEKLTIEKAKAELIISNSLSNESHQDQERFESETIKRRELSDSDIQKLVLAKAKLNSVLSFADDLKGRHNWM